jgi:hypothetical protein
VLMMSHTGMSSKVPGPATASCCVAIAWSFSSAETSALWYLRILRMSLGDGIFKTMYP